jgi:hypothetical protein
MQVAEKLDCKGLMLRKTALEMHEMLKTACGGSGMGNKHI